MTSEQTPLADEDSQIMVESSGEEMEYELQFKAPVLGLHSCV